MRLLLFWSVLLGMLMTVLFGPPLSHADSQLDLPVKTIANNPLPMTRIASLSDQTNAEYVVVGNYVYASESGRLDIYGFNTPDSLQPVANYLSDTPLGSLEANTTGTQLFALSSGNSLLLYDTSNPLAPIEQSRLFIPNLGTTGGIRLMQFMGNHLYLLSENTKQIYIYSSAGNVLTLQSYFSYHTGVVSIADKQVAEESGLPREGPAMFLEGNTLVITRYFGGAAQISISLYDVSDVTQPWLAGTVPSLGGFAMPANGHLYVFNRPVGYTYLDIWDIRNPYAPQLASSTPNVDGLPISRYGNQMVIQQPASYGQWHWYDVTNPTSLQSIAVVEAPEEAVIDSIQWRSPTLFYYTDLTYRNAFLRATLTSASTLSLVSLYEYPRVDKSIIVANRYLYTWGQYAGVNIYDLQSPATPRFVGRRLIPEFPNGAGPNASVERVGNRLYVNRGTDIAILNTDNPLDPYLTATFTFPIPNQYKIIHATPDYLYARTTNPTRLLSIRLSDYQSSVTPFPCNGIGIDGDLLIATCGDSSDNAYTFQVWDLVNPLVPQLRGTIARSAPFGTVIEIAAPFVYVMSDGTIEIYDVSNRDVPIHTFTLPPNSGQQSCAHLTPIGAGHYLRQCSSTTQDDIVNLSNPNGPQMTIAFGYPETSNSPVVLGDQVYFVDERIFEVWQINRPFIYLPFTNRYNLPFVQGR